jgi:hypothetical protein
MQITRTLENLVTHPRKTNQQRKTVTGVRRVGLVRIAPRWSSLLNQPANHHSQGVGSQMISAGAASLQGTYSSSVSDHQEN